MFQKSNAQLTNFGLVMAIPLTIIAVILFFKGHTIWVYFIAAALLFAVTGLVCPKILAPIEWAWMKFAKILGFIVTNILLTITFYVLITPLGLIIRLFGKDLLLIKRSKKADSYWIVVDSEGSKSSADKPY